MSEDNAIEHSIRCPMSNLRSIELQDREALISLFRDSDLMLEIKSANQKINFASNI